MKRAAMVVGRGTARVSSRPRGGPRPPPLVLLALALLAAVCLPERALADPVIEIADDNGRETRFVTPASRAIWKRVGCDGGRWGDLWKDRRCAFFALELAHPASPGAFKLRSGLEATWKGDGPFLERSTLPFCALHPTHGG